MAGSGIRAVANKVRVLILCTGNSARSQMAEGMLRKMAGDIAEVLSAGVSPAEEIHPLARRVMEEQGVSLAGQCPKYVDLFTNRPFDIILTVCDHAREHCPFFPGSARRIHWSLPDPADAEGTEEDCLEAFRRTAAELAKRLQDLMALIQSIHRK